MCRSPLIFCILGAVIAANLGFDKTMAGDIPTLRPSPAVRILQPVLGVPILSVRIENLCPETLHLSDVGKMPVCTIEIVRADGQRCPLINPARFWSGYIRTLEFLEEADWEINLAELFEIAPGEYTVRFTLEEAGLTESALHHDESDARLFEFQLWPKPKPFKPPIQGIQVPAMEISKFIVR